MSYSLGLDEMKEQDLKSEIRRRREARAKGLCDYCGRAPSEVSCRFVERHQLPLKASEVRGGQASE